MKFLNFFHYVAASALLISISGLTWIVLFGTSDVQVSQDPTNCEDSLSVINNSLDINETAMFPSNCLNAEGDFIAEKFTENSSDDKLKKTEEGLIMTK